MSTQEFDEQLRHLIWMCDLGQKHYAWHRAKEIERDDKQFKGLCDALVKQMKERTVVNINIKRDGPTE